MEFKFLTPSGGIKELYRAQHVRVNFNVRGLEHLNETDVLYWFFDDPYSTDDNPNIVVCNKNTIEKYHVYSVDGIYFPKLLIFDNVNNREIATKLVVGSNRIVCSNKPVGVVDSAFMPKLVSFFKDDDIRYTIDGNEPTKSSDKYVPEDFIDYNNINLNVVPTSIYKESGQIVLRYAGFNPDSEIPFYSGGFTLYFDTIKPIISWISTPPRNDNTASSLFTIRCNKVVKYLHYIHNGIAGKVSDTYKINLIAAQNNDIEIYAEDHSGFISNKLNYSWKVN